MGGLKKPASGAENTEPVFQIPVGLPSLERGRRNGFLSPKSRVMLELFSSYAWTYKVKFVHNSRITFCAMTKKPDSGVQVWAKYEWRRTDGTCGVGTLDPLLMGPSSWPSWTPVPMGIPQKGNLYTYIHTYIQMFYQPVLGAYFEVMLTASNMGY